MSTHPPMAGNPKHGSGDGISYHHCNTGEGELGAAPHNTGIQVLEWWLCLLWLSDRTRETRDSPAHTLQTWGGPRPGSCCSASGPPSPSVGYSPLLEQSVTIMVLQFGDQYCDNTQDSGTHYPELCFLNIKVGRIQQPTVSPCPY